MTLELIRKTNLENTKDRLSNNKTIIILKDWKPYSKNSNINDIFIEWNNKPRKKLTKNIINKNNPTIK